MEVIRTCPVCDKEFNAKRGLSSYLSKTCSRSCAGKLGAKHKEKELYCAWCGDKLHFRFTNKIAYCADKKVFKCKECDKEFESYCYEKRDLCIECFNNKKSWNKYCLNCNERKTSSETSNFCSGHCQKVYVAANKSKREISKKIHYCIECGQRFQSYGDAKFCSSSCRNTHTHKNMTYKPRECIYCGSVFTPTSSSQKVCTDFHTIECKYCSKEIKLQGTIPKNKHFCDRVCQTLYQHKSSLKLELLDEYKNADDWANKFENKRKRKPNAVDFKDYFGVNLPKWVDYSNFAKNTTKSRLEQKVLNYIIDNFELTVETNRKILPVTKYKQEIDILLPDIRLGIEVQGNATHSKVEGEFPMELYGGALKSTPAHFKKKQKAAEELGITLIEIWEDEIENNSFKKELSRLINERIVNLIWQERKSLNTILLKTSRL